jgi:hypothetical protein
MNQPSFNHDCMTVNYGDNEIFIPNAFHPVHENASSLPMGSASFINYCRNKLQEHTCNVSAACDNL